MCLCIQSQEFLCLKSSCCLAPGAASRGCCLVTEEDECCKIGCIICDYGLIMPKGCCTGASQCLCVRQVASCPFHEDYIDECVCAVCCISCAPECGCCTAPPHCKALDEMKAGGIDAPSNSNMER